MGFRQGYNVISSLINHREEATLQEVLNDTVTADAEAEAMAQIMQRCSREPPLVMDFALTGHFNYLIQVFLMTPLQLSFSRPMCPETWIRN